MRSHFFEIFKPVFIYQKYWLAHRLLSMVCNSTLWVYDENDGQNKYEFIHNISLPRIDFQRMIKKLPNVKAIKILQTIDLLEKRKHIEKLQKEDLLLFGIVATKEGAQAYDDGFYIKKVYASLFGVLIALGSLLFVLTKIKSLLT